MMLIDITKWYRFKNGTQRSRLAASRRI